jgi:hypothetical protein
VTTCRFQARSPEVTSVARSGKRQRPASRVPAVTFLTCALAAAPVLAGELVKPTIDVNDMRVIVSYVSREELAQLQSKWGGDRIDLREIRQDYRRGFSILRTNRESGARTCEIYLPKDKRPSEVDDAATLTLGHELLHCMLGEYHR